MRKISLLLAVLFVTKSFAQNEFSVTANIFGIDTGFVYLSYPKDTRNDTSSWIKDSLPAITKTLRFKGNISEPHIAILSFSNRKIGKILFYIDKGEITISGKSDDWDNIVINGFEDSETNAYEKLRTISRLKSPLLDSLDTLYEKAEKDNDKKAMQKYEEAYEKAEWELHRPLTYTFFYEHPKNIVSISILEDLMYSALSADSLKNMFSSLSPQVKNSNAGKKFTEKLAIYAQTEVGKPAPSFKQRDINGKEIDFSKVTKGKVLLLDFWASWCGPCRRENPNVVAAYEKYHTKGLEILGISLDEKKEKWEAAIEKDKLNWQHLSDLQGWKNEAAKRYAVRAIPSNFLIDANGIIIAKNLRGEALEKKLEELLK